jgi:esterase/lipase superfamily enzyme
MSLLKLVHRPLFAVFLLIVISSCGSEELAERKETGRQRVENAELSQEVTTQQETSESQSRQLDRARIEAEAERESLREATAAQQAEDRSREFQEATESRSYQFDEAAEARSYEFEPAADEDGQSAYVRESLEPLPEVENYIVVPPTTAMAMDEMAFREATATREKVVYEEISEDDEPTLMTLFYGTNRARLNNTFSDYFRPFILPALLILALVASMWLIRVLVKTRIQGKAKIAVSAVLLLFIFWRAYAGVAGVVQMRQADELNPVQYGPMRLEVDGGGLPYELGTCTVSIPPGHVPGIVERPDITHFEIRSDPKKHFVLSGINPLAESDFYTKLKTRIYESDDKDLFVFVHGFHNTFEDAAFRTAQIAHDLKFQGAPVFFSWPSQGTVLNYAEDENNVRVAIADLKLFLQRIRDQSGAERIHLIAHSMGSRALTNAIAAISAELGDGPVFNELVLAAPDIDSKVLDQMAESIAGAVDRITLYASSKDEALAASRFVHGGTYQRAGETQPLPLVNEWIQTIDVSSVTSGHSYIADDGQVLSDLDDLLTRSREISEINAVKIAVGNGYYWELRSTSRHE